MLECMNFIKDSQMVTRPKTTSAHADNMLCHVYNANIARMPYDNARVCGALTVTAPQPDLDVRSLENAPQVA
jgi:hypothetical protein